LFMATTRSPSVRRKISILKFRVSDDHESAKGIDQKLPDYKLDINDTPISTNQWALNKHGFKQRSVGYHIFYIG
jgi:hypothetical protein